MILRDFLQQFSVIIKATIVESLTFHENFQVVLEEYNF